MKRSNAQKDKPPDPLTISALGMGVGAAAMGTEVGMKMDQTSKANARQDRAEREAAARPKNATELLGQDYVSNVMAKRMTESAMPKPAAPAAPAAPVKVGSKTGRWDDEE